MKKTNMMLGAVLLMGCGFAATAQDYDDLGEAPKPAQQERPAKTFAELLELIEEDEKAQTQTEAGIPEIPSPPAANTYPQRTTPGVEKPLPWRNNDVQAFGIHPRGGINHIFSGFACPDKLGAIPRTDVFQFSVSGHDVGCNYTSPDQQTFITFYMSAFGEAGAPAKVVGEVTDNLVRLTSAKIDNGGKIDLSLGDTERPCAYATFDITNNGTPAKTAIYVCSVGIWSFKTRVTWGANRADPLLLIKRFMANQHEFIARARTCSAHTDAVLNMPRSNIQGLTYRADGFEYKRKGLSCVVHVTNNLMLLRWPENPATPITVHYFDSQGQVGDAPFFRVQDMWAYASPEERGENGYLLIREDTDGQMTIYNGYNRIPAANMVIENVADAITGKNKASLVAKKNASGGYTVAKQ